MEFLNSKEVAVKNGGYLVSKDGKAVTNGSFLNEQELAHYVVTFAACAKGKDLKGTKAYTLDQIRADVAKKLATTDTSYVKVKEVKEGKVTASLKEEALAFIEGTKKADQSSAVNSFMQRFNTLNQFEEFGLYFEEGVSKIDTIYTVKEVLDAVNSCIDLLD